MAAVQDALDALSNFINPAVTSIGDSLVFPADLNDKYYFSMYFFEYSRSNLMQVAEKNALGSVRLPLPNSLSDGYNVSYAEEELGTALGAAADAIAGVGAGSNIFNSAATVATAAASNLAQKNYGTVSSAVSAFAGVTTNPFMTVLFKNPNYKEYSFSWRLFPKNQTETGNLMDIISAIRYNMLPGQIAGSTGAFLTYPSIVQCYATTGAGSLYPFKPAVIKNATFNYAPDGTPSFYKDGNPTAVDIKVDMQEVEYFLKEDLPFGVRNI